MARFRSVLTALALLQAAPALANTVECGGNAFTFAEVTEGRPGGAWRGPVMSVPDTLCADLIEDRPPFGGYGLQIDLGGRPPAGSEAVPPARRGSTGATRPESPYRTR